MSESSRRNFLIASGAGAAAIGVAAALPGTAAAQAGRASQSTPLRNPRNAEPLVAHVADPSTGTLSLFVADREVVLHDPDLVARLTRAAAGSSAANTASVDSREA